VAESRMVQPSCCRIMFFSLFLMAIALQLKRIATPPTPLSLVIIPALVLVAISKIMFRRNSGRVDFDERDVQILGKAHITGLWSFVLSVVIQNVICVLAIGPHRSLNYPLVILLMICSAGGIWIITESIATLAMYNSQNEGKTHA
jgi:hypothetical protein